MSLPRCLASALVVASGCTGLSLGENMPGGDTWVDPGYTEPGEHRMGAVAVERDEDQIWVVHEENRGGFIKAHLTAINPATGRTYEALDVSDLSDRRVVFPAADRMIFMGQNGDRDHLVLLDTSTRTPIAEVTAPTWYWGTRTAPSGRALVVADNVDPLAPLHVIDTATLSHQVIEHGGQAIEAMWNHHEDILLALSVSDPFGNDPTARLLRYDLTAADPAAPLPEPSVVWELGGYGWDYFFSYTWIGISPDDQWAVFPLIKRTTGSDDGEHVLLVLNQSTGGVTLVPGSGPVGFTRDSRFIVSYGFRADSSDQDLWLIDPATTERKVVTLPFVATVSFIVSSETDAILCAPVTWDSAQGAPKLAVYDVVAETMRTIDDASLNLWDYVTRRGTDELWLESSGHVSALSLGAARLDRVAIDGSISSINVRPSADQAVAGDAEQAAIWRVDMATRTVAGPAVRLPSPFEAPTGHGISLPRSHTLADRVQSPFDPAYRPPTVHLPGVRTAL